MRGSLQWLAILFLILFAFRMDSVAAPQLDPRLAPMAEVYGRNSRMVIYRGVEQQYEALAAYRAELQGQISQLTPPEQWKKGPKELVEVREDGSIARYDSEVRERKSGKLSSTEVETKSALARIVRDLEQGLVDPDPLGLQKPEHARHHQYLKSVQAAREKAIKDKHILDQRYLAALAKLESQANGDQALLSQIKAQMKLVKSGGPAPLTDLSTQLPGSRWQRTNSPKEYFHFPRGTTGPTWSYSVADARTVVARFFSLEPSAPAITTTWKLGDDGKTLLKEGVPDLQLVHPDVVDLLKP